MSRNINAIHTSETFWSDLKKFRKEHWYPEVRAAIGRFVQDVMSGSATTDRGFSNPALKGVFHLRLPNNLRMFHIYEGQTLHLCMVDDHRAYGFNGKHRAAEVKVADRAKRAMQEPLVISPGWDGIKWKTPACLIGNPEVKELSIEGIQSLIEELDEESHSLRKAKKAYNARTIEALGEDDLEGWLTGLIAAHEAAYARLEVLCARPLVDSIAPVFWECEDQESTSDLSAS